MKRLLILIFLINLISTPRVQAQESFLPNNSTNSVSQAAKLLKVLQNYKKQLDKQKALLAKKEKQLEILKQEISKEIDQFDKLKQILDRYFKKLKKMQTERYDKLAEIFSATSPQEASKQLEKMDPAVAAQILIRMDGTKAGKIWGYLNPQAAAKITQEMIKLR